MESQGTQRLPGMRDLFEEEYRRSRRVQDGLQSFLALYGYRTVDTPVVEPTDIFLRKSGGELASQMYTFVEPGGHQVSLRPEFTSQVIRLFLQEERNDERSRATPVRWQYAGPVFRYSPGETRYGRQFTQVGAELIGAAGASAEAEVMAMACGALASLGLGSQRMVLGDVGAVYGLLKQFKLSERATYFLLYSMGELRDGEDGLASVRARGQELGLFDSDERRGSMEALAQHLATTEANGNGASDGSIGVRTSQEVMERLERKLQAADSPEQLDNALTFTQALAGMKGAPKDTLKATRSLAESHKLDASPLSSLEASIDAFALHEMKSVEVSVDLCLARDIAYYTGPVFEVWAGASGNGVRLAGGGRYDGLVKALGGSQDVPALGFACTLELVIDALDEDAGDTRPVKRVLVAPRNDSAVKATLQAAASLRIGGEVAAVSLDGAADQAGAKAQGFEAIIMVAEDGTSERIWL